jgi:2-polyprenyl-3-methyl-5-hydroxy-6-metoxy-1,4-benzoquinol methylase
MSTGRATHSICNLCAAEFPTAAAVVLVKDGHTIVRCPNCELVFRASLPDPSEVPELYGPEYFAATDGDLGHEGYLNYVADADVHRLNARRRLRELGRLASPGNLLDVGCAAGFFVDEASRAGWKARGIDVSAPMVEWGRARLEAELAVGSLIDLPEDRSESCITMWDYIEHALDPRGDLERASVRLRPGGLLALSTGDVRSLLARLSLAKWHLMTPRHHNYFFSTRTIQRLLRATGFEIVRIGHPASVFPMRYLAHKSGLSVDVRPVAAAATRLARSRLGAVRVPMNLWDVMTVVARRPLHPTEGPP